MKLFKTINKSFENIHDNLSFDDTFHTTFDQNPDNLYLRLWELNNYSIVLGRSNQAEKELNLDLVQKNNIRLKIKSKKNRYDKFSKNFYLKVQNGFLKLSKKKKNYLKIYSDETKERNKQIIQKKLNSLIKIK